MTPVRTADLPATPVRDRDITAAEWDEAPSVLPRDAVYRRRIGSWLLWRVGPPRGDDMRYFAFHADDLGRWVEFPGAGPSGTVHERFRTWKEDLRDSP